MASAVEDLEPKRKFNLDPDKKVPEIAVLMDMSGSMSAIRNDVIGAFNSFLADQQRQAGEARIMLSMFDDDYVTVYDRVPIADAAPLTLETFVPRGMTALIDSAVRLLGDLEKRDPDAAVIAIITDGEENASRYAFLGVGESVEAVRSEMNRTDGMSIQERGKRALTERISAARERGWLVLFLAANQDAIKVGGSIGVAQANSVIYAATAGAGTVGNVASALSGKVADYRNVYRNSGGGVRGAMAASRSKGTAFTDEERIGSVTPTDSKK